MNKPNGTTILSPADIIAADNNAAMQAFDYPGLQADFEAMRAKWNAQPAILAFIIDGELRFMCYGGAKDQIMHLLGAVIQGFAVTQFRDPPPVASDDKIPVTAIVPSLPE